MNLTLEHAQECDAADPLKHFAARFFRPDGTLYFIGNSLGLLSQDAEAALLRVLNEWKTQGIDGWMNADPPWLSLAEDCGELLAPLIGAQPHEVIATGSTTANLHQLLATLYDPNLPRKTLLADALNFPSDGYALESHLRGRGLDPERYLVRVPSDNGLHLDEERIIAAMTDEVQMAVLPSVMYTSGQLLDMKRVTRAAHERGILIGWDCSHSVGAVPHQLSEWGADFAFWCSYKYLNSGPGAVGGLYLNARHRDKLPGMAGWWGSRKDRQFDMTPEFHAADGAGRLQIGTAHLLSLAPLYGSLQVFHEAGLENLRRKSLALTEYLLMLIETELMEHDFQIASPREPERRGGHLALVHSEAARICKALKVNRVVPDFRAPNLIRLTPAPLYCNFADCWNVVHILKRIMETRQYESFPSGRELVA
jgi:kynureninase